jgi:hypothetical protein
MYTTLVAYVFILLNVSVDMLWFVVAAIVIIRFSAIVVSSRLKRVSLPVILVLSILTLLFSAVALSTALPEMTAGNFSHPVVFLLTIAMVLSFYSFLSEARFGDLDEEQSYSRAVLALYEKYADHYSEVIPAWFKKGSVQHRILFSIMITEDLNRPKIARLFERIIFKRGNNMSTGIMQFQSSTYLSNDQSIALASKMIQSSYRNHVKTEKDEYLLIRHVANDYNSSVYAEIVSEVYYILKKHKHHIDELS